MIDRTTLLEDLKRLVTRVEADLLARSEDADVPEIAEVLRSEYERARAAKRTADTYGEWREDRITQAAVAWVLSCVFVRFLEDNDLIAPPRIAGPGERLRNARDAHQHYFLSHPRDTDREYLLSIFDELAASPGTSGIFGPHNALREIPNWLSGDKAREVIQFFQKIDANTGLLIHDFTDPAWDTRFLGDLYQDLSAYARSRYALLQTPHFIEQFLLDRTLEPAIDEFGLTDSFKMIDPACGSGHLVLGSFERILDRWQRMEPATPVRELVRRTLGSVHGVDINPFAVAIARFRLLLVAMRACGIKRLADAPDFRLNIGCGDSLYHGAQKQRVLGTEWTDESHYFRTEDAEELRRLLRTGAYHCVVANPPYITVTDQATSQAYRTLYRSCHGKYSMAVPFTERILSLGVLGGFSGQITANGFMKHDYGKKLIAELLPSWDVTHIVDSSGVDIPGHGTPTVILLARARPPVGNTIRTVSGLAEERAGTTERQVWNAILQQIDTAPSQSAFVAVADILRERFSKHPWSLSSSGSIELRQLLSDRSQGSVASLAKVGICLVTLDNDAFTRPLSWLRRWQIPPQSHRIFVEAAAVRDWGLADDCAAIFPYDAALEPHLDVRSLQLLWPFRTSLWNRQWFRQSQKARGREWFEYGHVSEETLRRATRAVACSDRSSHNHFSLSVSDGRIFNQGSPVITAEKSHGDEFLDGLLGVLQSSVTLFWMREQCFAATAWRDTSEPWDECLKVHVGAIESIPIPHGHVQTSDLATKITQLAATRRSARDWLASNSGPSLTSVLESNKAVDSTSAGQSISLQEELDWKCYHLFGLCETDLSTPHPPPLELGQRAFEIVMARRVAAGGLQTAWFERHHSSPFPDIPEHWPDGYRQLVEQRIELILTDPTIGILESPEYKRRWSTEPWEKYVEQQLCEMLLERLESYVDLRNCEAESRSTPTPPLTGLVSIGTLADSASRDPVFMEAAEVFVGGAGFDTTALVGQLVEKASVPFLPVLRYKATGLRKHEEWKEVWELQRKEDTIDARTTLPSDDRNHLTTEQAADLKRRDVGDIPVPPKYASADFASSTYWSLRGKLDVPKERFVSFPFVAGADGQTMIAWAGLDHLQLAKAIGDFYGLVQNDIGGSDDPRLVPLLAAIHELLPWIRQWHAGNDPVYGGEPADFFEDFLRTEAAGRGMTVAEVIAWQPPARTRAKRAAKKAAKRATKKKPSETEAEAP